MGLSVGRFTAGPLASIALLVGLALAPTHAVAASKDAALDAAGLAQLEERADHAQAREQCFLYTELVHNYIEVAGKQVAAGDLDQASASLKRVQAFADKIHMGLARDSKRLKNAEMMVHAASYHLAQFLHQVSSEDSAIIEITLKQLNRVHDELLAQVFAH